MTVPEISSSSIPTTEINSALLQICNDVLADVSQFSQDNSWSLEISQRAAETVSEIFTKRSPHGPKKKIICTTSIIEKKVALGEKSETDKVVQVTTAASWDPETDGLIHFKHSECPFLDVVLVIAYISTTIS